MDRFRRMILAATLGLTLVSVPATTLAATPQYALSGIEYAATAYVGSFAGVAVAADDYGTWQATIVHAALPTATTDPGAAITNGTFALDGRYRDLAGLVTGGWITLTSTSTCGKQTYSVTGALTLANAAGSGAFGVVLTHYRVWLWGHCITYGATVKGSVTFALS